MSAQQITPWNIFQQPPFLPAQSFKISRPSAPGDCDSAEFFHSLIEDKSLPENPAWQSVTGVAERWLREETLLTAGNARRSLERIRFDKFAGVTLPYANLQDLSLHAQWIYWLHLFDDEFDEGPLGKEPLKCRVIIERLAAALESGEMPGLRPIDRALVRLVQRTVDGHSASWQKRVYEHVYEYIWSYVAEADAHARDYVMSVDEYLAHRAKSGGMKICADVIEHSSGVELSATVLRLPAFAAIYEGMNMMICLSNDIMGFEKDASVGYANSLIHVVRNQKRCSLGYAMLIASGIFHKYVEMFRTNSQLLETQMVGAGISSRERVKVFKIVEAYKQWAQGYTLWAGKSLRFVSVQEKSAVLNSSRETVPA